MRNKGVVVFLGVVITFLCLYYLSFTFVSSRVDQDAIDYATDQSGSLNLSKKQNYLDSIWNQPVYNPVSYTHLDVYKRQILKFDMEMLEIK